MRPGVTLKRSAKKRSGRVSSLIGKAPILARPLVSPKIFWRGVPWLDDLPRQIDSTAREKSLQCVHLRRPVPPRASETTIDGVDFRAVIRHASHVIDARTHFGEPCRVDNTADVAKDEQIESGQLWRTRGSRVTTSRRKCATAAASSPRHQPADWNAWMIS